MLNSMVFSYFKESIKVCDVTPSNFKLLRNH
jgi:hypothetical protein